MTGLIVSNHLSYLDVLVLSAATRCAFVSKAEVRAWPFIGRIAAETGAVFVDRSRRSQTDSVSSHMRDWLQTGQVMVLFPEGTSSNGRELLPFHSSLLEAAIAAAVPATAAYICYALDRGEGDPSTDVCFWGEMTLLPHALKLLTKLSVKATVRFAGEPKTFSDRKQAALELRREIMDLANAEVNPAHQGADALNPACPEHIL